MSYRSRPSVTVIRKAPFSVVYSKVCEDSEHAYDHSREMEEYYGLDEYNIVLTLDGAFDILRYLDIINKEKTLYMN
tara:strand:+ start:825 stop:1052 length:228 start_codon:yes stop_codon:yes gene_type:complete